MTFRLRLVKAFAYLYPTTTPLIDEALNHLEIGRLSMEDLKVLTSGLDHVEDYTAYAKFMELMRDISPKFTILEPPSVASIKFKKMMTYRDRSSHTNIRMPI